MKLCIFEFLVPGNLCHKMFAGRVVGDIKSIKLSEGREAGNSNACFFFLHQIDTAENFAHFLFYILGCGNHEQKIRNQKAEWKTPFANQINLLLIILFGCKISRNTISYRIFKVSVKRSFYLALSRVQTKRFRYVSRKSPSQALRCLW